MEPFSLTSAALAAGTLGLGTLGAWASRRGRARSGARPQAADAPALASPALPSSTPPSPTLPPSTLASPALASPEAAARRLELRMEAIEAAQAGLAARVEGGAEAERLQAMAGQILGLVRDKAASLDTALAGLDQLRARLRVLEQMGAPAEARTLLDALETRLAAVERADAMAAARLARLETAPPPLAEVSDRLAALHAQKDAALEAALGRLAPLEAKLSEVETALAARDPRGALERFGERLDAARSAQEAQAATLADRLTALEGAPSPLAEVSDRLAALHAQKDAALEAALGRLAPLEAKLSEVETALAARDPRGALERFGERLEAVQNALGERLEAVRSAQDMQAATLADRLTALEGAPSPLAEVSDRLAALHAQKDAALEAALGRLAPLEAKLSEVEASFAARDPRGALERFGERLEAVQNALGERLDAARSAQEAQAATLADRLTALEGAPSPLAEVSGRLAALQGRVDGLVLAGADAAAAAEADAEAAMARAEAQAIAAQLVAARTVAEETRLFAGRIALLEASLPRLSLAQALMMQALERQAAPAAAGWPRGVEAPAAGAASPDAVPDAPVLAPVPAPALAPSLPGEPGATDPEDAAEPSWRLPRVVSVHTG